jgi:hypothetical protein
MVKAINIIGIPFQAIHVSFILLVKHMLALPKNLTSAKTPHRESVGKESTRSERQVETCGGWGD